VGYESGVGCLKTSRERSLARTLKKQSQLQIVSANTRPFRIEFFRGASAPCAHCESVNFTPYHYFRMNELSAECLRLETLNLQLHKARRKRAPNFRPEQCPQSDATMNQYRTFYLPDSSRLCNFWLSGAWQFPFPCRQLTRYPQLLKAPF
jgi:hypothetical protein